MNSMRATTATGSYPPEKSASGLLNGGHGQDEEEEEQNEDESLGFDSTEQLSLFRSHLKIKVYGTDIPNPFRSFSGLAQQYKLEPYLERNILASGFKKPTPIQMQAIPVILHVGFYERHEYLRTNGARWLLEKKLGEVSGRLTKFIALT